MKTNRNKTAIAAAAIGGVLLAGGATMAAAAPEDANRTGTSSSTDKPGEGGENEKDEASFTGTITAPPGTSESEEAKDGTAEEKAEGEAETAALAGLATVSEERARTSATDAAPGSVDKITLADEEGFVVWEAEITQADRTTVEVLIDAGDGSVLTQEVEHADEEGDDAEDDGDQSGDTQAPGPGRQNDLQEATSSN